MLYATYGYTDAHTDREACSAARKLFTAVFESVVAGSLPCLVVGDFNCELVDILGLVGSIPRNVRLTLNFRSASAALNLRDAREMVLCRLEDVWFPVSCCAF